MSLIELVFFGGIAVFIILRYRSMLGRRDGHEQQPPQNRNFPQRGEAEDNVIELPNAQTDGPKKIDPEASIDRVAQRGSEVHAGLTQIALADREFDAQGFVGGAKAAYEMIVTAFADGDRSALKPLLSDDVYQGFEEVIANREAANQKAETQIIGINEAKIIEAGLNDRNAEVTVRFRTEMITSVRNQDGAILEGHPNTVTEVIDSWTFERNVDSDNPNWYLVSTSG